MQQQKAISLHSRDFQFSKALVMGIRDRTVTGIFCVHGNVDSGDGWSSRDRSHPGLFNDFLVDGRRRAVFLWQHRSYDPPTATIDRLFEVSRADLPPAVLKYAPDASGGVAVERTYDTDDYSDRIFRKIVSGALTEMSYAYEATRWDYEKETSDSYLPVRNIYEADLYDVSDVNWGMNPATSSDGSKAMPLAIERQTVHAAVKHYIERMESLFALRVVKEGRRFSSATLKEIEESIAILREGNTASEEAIGRLEKLIAAPEDDDGKTARQQSQALRMQSLETRRRLLELGVTL